MANPFEAIMQAGMSSLGMAKDWYGLTAGVRQADEAANRQQDQFNASQAQQENQFLKTMEIEQDKIATEKEKYALDRRIFNSAANKTALSNKMLLGQLQNDTSKEAQIFKDKLGNKQIGDIWKIGQDGLLEVVDEQAEIDLLNYGAMIGDRDKKAGEARWDARFAAMQAAQNVPAQDMSGVSELVLRIQGILGNPKPVTKTNPAVVTNKPVQTNSDVGSTYDPNLPVRWSSELLGSGWKAYTNPEESILSRAGGLGKATFGSLSNIVTQPLTAINQAGNLTGFGLSQLTLNRRERELSDFSFDPYQKEQNRRRSLLYQSLKKVSE